MRSSLNQWAMDMVAVTAKRSTCCRRNVGCVLLNRHNEVIATGVNGVRRGAPHCNEVVRIVNPALLDLGDVARKPEHWESTHIDTYPNACSGAKSPSGMNLDGCQAIHAEQNALMQCRDMHSIKTAYVSTSPCLTCVKLLLNTSCEEIVFQEEYPHTEARNMWESAGRKWTKFTG